MSGRRRYIYVAGCVFGADTVPRRAHGGSQSFAVLSPTRPTSMYRRQRGAHVDGRRRLRRPRAISRGHVPCLTSAAAGTAPSVDNAGSGD